MNPKDRYPGLSKREAQVVDQREDKGRTPTEAAEALGIDSTTIWTYYHRATKKIKLMEITLKNLYDGRKKRAEKTEKKSQKD